MTLGALIARRGWLEARIESLSEEMERTEQECRQPQSVSWYTLRWQYLVQLEEAHIGLAREVAKLNQLIAKQQMELQTCRAERKKRELLALKQRR